MEGCDLVSCQTFLENINFALFQTVFIVNYICMCVCVGCYVRVMYFCCLK